jgi:hypothetical protein
MANWEEALSQLPVLQSLVPQLDRAAALAIFAVSRRLRTALATDGDVRGAYFEVCAPTFRKMLCDVAAWGDLPALRAICGRRAVEVRGPPRRADDPLIIEAMRSGFDLNRFLMLHDPSPGYLALNFSARAGRANVVQYIMEELNIIPTPITQILAIEGGSLAVVQMLVAKMFPSPSGDKFRTIIVLGHDKAGIVCPQELQIWFGNVKYSALSDIMPSHFDIHAWLSEQ